MKGLVLLFLILYTTSAFCSYSDNGCSLQFKSKTYNSVRLATWLVDYEGKTSGWPFLRNMQDQSIKTEYNHLSFDDLVKINNTKKSDFKIPDLLCASELQFNCKGFSGGKNFGVRCKENCKGKNKISSGDNPVYDQCVSVPKKTRTEPGSCTLEFNDDNVAICENVYSGLFRANGKDGILLDAHNKQILCEHKLGERASYIDILQLRKVNGRKFKYPAYPTPKQGREYKNSSFVYFKCSGLKNGELVALICNDEHQGGTPVDFADINGVNVPLYDKCIKGSPKQPEIKTPKPDDKGKGAGKSTEKKQNKNTLPEQKTPATPKLQPSFNFVALDDMLNNYFQGSSEWKNDEGGFNTARLASDSIAGIVLGTAGGIVTSKIIKKNQIKSGFESLKCTIGGQDVANFGDEFQVGVK